MSEVLFKEKQRYDNKLVLIILGLISLLAIVGGIKSLLKTPTHYYETIILFITALVIGVLIWWLTKLKMKVTISEKSIKFKISPIYLKKRSIPWKEIEECEIVKTSEAAQWSGGNITFKREKRFSFIGRNGLAIKTKKGEYYFIGCKKIAELQQALNKINLK